MAYLYIEKSILIFKVLEKCIPSLITMERCLYILWLRSFLVVVNKKPQESSTMQNSWAPGFVVGFYVQIMYHNGDFVVTVKLLQL